MGEDILGVSGEDVARALFTHAGIALAVLDLAGRVLEASDAFVALFAADPAGLPGRDVVALLHPVVRARVRAAFEAVTAGGGGDRFRQDVVGLDPGGTAFSAELVGSAVRGPDGRVGALLAVVRPDGMLEHGDRIAYRGQLLTELDARILEGVAAGESNVQLAARLHLSRQGIEYRVSAMLRRLRAGNRAALVARAYASGLLTVGTWPPAVAADLVE